MLKFLRKYQKFLLVFFGVFLMIVFVAPQAVQQLGQSSLNRTVALVGSKKVRLQELQAARREREAIRQFLGMFLAPGEVAAYTGEDEVHWYLLVHSAHEGGYVGEAGDGRDWMRELGDRFASYLETQLQGSDLDPQALLEQAQSDLEGLRRRVSEGNRLPLEEFDLALAKARGVGRMLGSYVNSPRLSAPAAVAEAKEHLDQIALDYVAIPGDRGFEGEISEEMLAEHFARYQNAKPGEGEFGVGYVRPRRVRIELLTFDRDAIERSVPVSARDAIDAYDSDPARYPGGRSEATEEEREAAKAIELERVRADIRAARADLILAEASKQVRLIVLPTIPFGAGGVAEVPEGASRVGPTFEEIADEVSEHLTAWSVSQFEAREGTVRIPRPDVLVLDRDWLTLDDLTNLEGVGLAQVQLQGNRVQRFANFVIGCFRDASEVTPGDVARPQVAVPAVQTPIRDAVSGNISFVRVLDVREESPAETLDEVRKQAEADLRAILGYEALRERESEFRAVALEGGLEGVAALFAEDEAIVGPEGEVPAPPKAPLRVTRGAIVQDGVLQTPYTAMENGSLRTRFEPSDMSDESLVSEIEQLARSLDPMRSMEDTPIDMRALVTSVPRKRSLVVALITGVRPLTVELYRSKGDATALGATRLPFSPGVENPFSLPSLVARWDYRRPDGGDPLAPEEDGQG